MKAGFIGLGDIGRPIAERILLGEGELAVWNRTIARARPLGDAGATIAETPASLASMCDIVILCVDSAEALREILFREQGIASATRRPRLVVDHSTIHPSEAQHIANCLEELQIGFIDAPVSGGAAGAIAGTLAIMVGGSEADVALAEPLLGHYANRVTHMGAVGAGQATKACNQIINFGTLASIAEALALAGSFGLNEASLPGALAGGFADSNMLREYTRGREGGEKAHFTALADSLVLMLRGEAVPPGGGRFQLVLKDLGIATSLARDHGVGTPLSAVAESLVRIANGASSNSFRNG